MGSSGWNKPVDNQPRKAPKKPSPIRGIVAGLVVVCALGGLCIWMFSGGDSKPAPKSEKKPTRIAEVAPVATNVAVKTPSRRHLTNREIRKLTESETNQLNAAEVAYWKIYHPYPPPDKWQPEPKHGKYHIFSSKVDNDIAFLIAVEPGTPIFGSSAHFADGFRDKFLKSLTRPIIVKADDSDYVKELKRAVIEAKADLKAAYDRGEDIEEIMRKSREDAVKLGQIKLDIQREVAKMRVKTRLNGGSAEDIADVVKAANLVLEAKGIAPMNIGPITARSMQFNNNQEAGK